MNLLQWVNLILFLLHQLGNGEPCRQITSKTEEQQTWGWRKKKLRGVDGEDTSEMKKEKTWRKEEEQTWGWKKNKLFSTSLTTSTPFSLLAPHPLLSLHQPPFLSRTQASNVKLCKNKNKNLKNTITSGSERSC